MGILLIRTESHLADGRSYASLTSTPGRNGGGVLRIFPQGTQVPHFQCPRNARVFRVYRGSTASSPRGPVLMEAPHHHMFVEHHREVQAYLLRSTTDAEVGQD